MRPLRRFATGLSDQNAHPARQFGADILARPADAGSVLRETTVERWPRQAGRHLAIHRRATNRICAGRYRLSGDREAFRNAISHLVLPVLLLAYYSLASITRLTRSACLSEMNKEYILLARAKGAGEMTILLRHVLPNIRSTLLTVIALAYTSMLEGAVLTETVFSWPGIGRYLTTALFAGDTTAVMGGTLLIGVCFVLINNLTDLLVRATDPGCANAVLSLLTPPAPLPCRVLRADRHRAAGAYCSVRAVACAAGSQLAGRRRASATAQRAALAGY